MALDNDIFQKVFFYYQKGWDKWIMLALALILLWVVMKFGFRVLWMGMIVLFIIWVVIIFAKEDY